MGALSWEKPIVTGIANDSPHVIENAHEPQEESVIHSGISWHASTSTVRKFEVTPQPWSILNRGSMLRYRLLHERRYNGTTHTVTDWSYDVNLEVGVQFGRAVYKLTEIGADKLGFFRPSKPLDTSSTESAIPPSRILLCVLQKLCGYRAQRARHSQQKNGILGGGGYVIVSNAMK